MADGSTKSIDEIKLSDQVLAADPDSDESGPREVTATIIGEGVKFLVEIDTGDGKITATDRHPFWFPDQERWVDANDLRAGSVMQTATGPWVRVAAIKKKIAIKRVFNLTVGGIHTYYALAGNTPVLVHNCGKDQGIYELLDMYKPGQAYVGKSINLTNRLGDHLRSGRLASADDGKIAHVCGCEDLDSVANQNRSAGP